MTLIITFTGSEWYNQIREEVGKKRVKEGVAFILGKYLVYKSKKKK